jgi:hypothetical protein
MKLIYSVPMLVLALAVTGCGKGGLPSFVKGAKVETHTQEGKAWAGVDVDLNTGVFVLPSFEVPIPNPKIPGSTLGTFSLKTILGGGSQVGIDMNLSDAVQSGLDGSKLPNGNPIPIAGIGDAAISFPITNGGSRVYLGIGSGVAMVGFALVVSQFDQLAKYFGGIDVFVPVRLPYNLTGTVGLFSSSEASKSGLAVFLDVSAYIKLTSATEFSSLMIGDLGYGTARLHADQMPRSLIFQNTSLSSRQARRVYQGINAVAARGQRVTVK